MRSFWCRGVGWGGAAFFPFGMRYASRFGKIVIGIFSGLGERVLLKVFNGGVGVPTGVVSELIRLACSRSAIALYRTVWRGGEAAMGQEQGTEASYLYKVRPH